MKINVILFLAVVNVIHCDECKLLFDFAIIEIGDSLRTIYNHLKGHDQLLERIPDMQEKLEHLENNLQDMQEKLEHLENNLQGLSRDTAQCLKGEDLEHLTNVSAAANQEIKSFVHEEISGVISLAQKDECLEGGLLCGEIGTCVNTPFSFTCSCPSGFTWDGSECKDVDECAEGKHYCVPNATCKNTNGSYSCSCNESFEGDGRTSCEFQCSSPAKKVIGMGCVKVIVPDSDFHHIKTMCEAEGGRLAQHMSLEQLHDMIRSLGFYGWVGIYDGKWMSDESLVPEDLWVRGYKPNPSKRCGFIGWDSSSSYILIQRECSYKTYGYCQLPMP